MEAKIKTITIQQEVTEDGNATTMETKGFTDFEIVGLLSYYIDAFKIGMLKRPKEKPAAEKVNKE